LRASSSGRTPGGTFDAFPPGVIFWAAPGSLRPITEFLSRSLIADDYEDYGAWLGVRAKLPAASVHRIRQGVMTVSERKQGEKNGSE